MAGSDENGTKRFQSEGEAAFRVALDAMGDGTWDWDLENGEVFLSDRWYQSLGYRRDEVTPDRGLARSIIHPDDWDKLAEVGTTHLEGQTEYFECEYRVRLKSGEYRWTLGRGRVVERDADGMAIRFLGTNFDITSAKQTELFFEDVEQRSRLIVETAGCVILCLDTDLRILEWNRAAEKIYGWTRDEVRGKNYVAWFLPKEVRGRVVEEIQRVLAGGEAKDYENPVVARDGTERLLLWNSRSLVNSDGKTWGLVAMGQDITEQRRAERQREIAYHEMEVLAERFEALRGLLRVCAVCKKISDQHGNWSGLDEYLHLSMEVEVTHGYCPTCYEAVKPRGDPEG